MRKILRQSFLLAFLLPLIMLATSVMAAGEFNLEKMVAQTRRPTVLEIYQALGNAWPIQNPVTFQENNYPYRFVGGRTLRVENSEQGMNNFLMAHLPQTIARLESLFPNATWALLGRDSVILADALEAYYLSIGQKDRVVRIDMSTGSFATSPEIIAEYLQGLGAPIDPKMASRFKPWIVIDRTSFGALTWHVSGARRVVEIIYDKFIANGGDPAIFPVSMNAVSLHPGDGTEQNGPLLIPFKDTSRDAYLASLQPGLPQKIVAIGSLVSDGMEWHQPFGPLIKDEKGQVQSVPGMENLQQWREQIVWEIINSGILLSSPEFQTKVDAEFIKLGLSPLSKSGNCSDILDDEVLLKRRKEIKK